MKLIDLSYHGSYYHLSAEDYLLKSITNIGYATFLKDRYDISFIFHSRQNNKLLKDGIAYRFRKKTFNSKFWFPISLSLKIARTQPDVIIVHSLFYIHFAAFLRFFVSRHTIIFIQHHGESIPISSVKRSIISYCDRYINGYLFTSKNMGAAWVQSKMISSLSKVFQVMEGSTVFKKHPKDQSKMLTTVSKSKPVFIWVGRLNKNKDPMCAIRAFKKLRDADYNFEFYMFYHTYELLDEIKRFITVHSLEDCVFLKGKIPHQELETWYSASDYVISASHKEAGGYAVCEAIASGCIPILSKIPSFEFMTKNGYSGLLFEKGNSDILFKKLQQAIGLDLEEYQRRNQEVFEEYLSFKAIAGQIDAVIHQCVSKNRS